MWALRHDNSWHCDAWSNLQEFGARGLMALAWTHQRSELFGKANITTITAPGIVTPTGTGPWGPERGSWEARVLWVPEWSHAAFAISDVAQRSLDKEMLFPALISLGPDYQQMFVATYRLAGPVAAVRFVLDAVPAIGGKR